MNLPGPISLLRVFLGPLARSREILVTFVNVTRPSSGGSVMHPTETRQNKPPRNPYSTPDSNRVCAWHQLCQEILDRASPGFEGNAELRPLKATGARSNRLLLSVQGLGFSLFSDRYHSRSRPRPQFYRDVMCQGTGGVQTQVICSLAAATMSFLRLQALIRLSRGHVNAH